MEKLFISKTKKIDSELTKELANAKKSPEFCALLKKIGITDELARKNVTKLNDTLESLNHCKNCKGLFACKNSVEGYVYFPSLNDSKIIFNYVPCKHQKQMTEAINSRKTESNELENARMKSIDITDKNRVKLIKWIKSFYDTYDTGKVAKGLYLHGTFGSGKTFLLAALLNELKIKKHINYEITYFPDLLRVLKDNFGLMQDKLNYLEKVEILVLDDIGAENVTAWGRDEILGTILQNRMNNNLTTFFTSNFNISELEKHLAITKGSEDYVKARRIVERIKQLTSDMELISENRRK